jgi:small subunit ribosomal protein S8
MHCVTVVHMTEGHSMHKGHMDFRIEAPYSIERKNFIMVNYTLSDMLTRLRNAIRVKKSKVTIVSTNLTKNITAILKREGYIEESYEENNELQLVLKYQGKKMTPTLTNAKCVSRPGVRFYANSKRIPQVLGGLGITIVSTSKGVFTDTEARKLGIGGEVLCMIW